MSADDVSGENGAKPPLPTARLLRRLSSKSLFSAVIHDTSMSGGRAAALAEGRSGSAGDEQFTLLTDSSSLDTLSNQLWLAYTALQREQAGKPEADPGVLVVLVGSESTKIFAHKHIVDARMPHISTLAKGSNSSAGEVFLPELHYDAVSALFKWAYTGKLLVTTSTMIPILEAAHFLGIGSTKNLITGYMRENLSAESVWDILDLARSTANDELSDGCLAYIANHTKEVLASRTSFLRTSPELVLAMLQRDDLGGVGEAELFGAVMDWWECRVDSSPTILAELLEHICFPSMSKSDLEEVIPSGVVPAHLIEEAKRCLDEPRALKDVPWQRRCRDPSAKDSNVTAYHVSGAGIVEANGVYVRDGEHDGVPMYTRGQLVLMRCQLTHKWWYISHRRDMSSPEGGFYRCASLAPLPPSLRTHRPSRSRARGRLTRGRARTCRVDVVRPPAGSRARANCRPPPDTLALEIFGAWPTMASRPCPSSRSRPECRRSRSSAVGKRRPQRKRAQLAHVRTASSPGWLSPSTCLLVLPGVDPSEKDHLRLAGVWRSTTANAASASCGGRCCSAARSQAVTLL